MLIWENIKLSFGSLRMNKMRSFLTMLGIVIGIGSVIAIMTVSASLTTSISTSFKDMGANNVTVGVKQKSTETEVNEKGMVFGSGNRNVSLEEDDRITDEMLEELKSSLEGKIKTISLSEMVGSAEARKSSYSANINITGINDGYYQTNDVTLLAGRRIKDTDVTGEKHVIMVSDLVVENLFDGDLEAALWQKLSVSINDSYYDYYIVGVYRYEETTEISTSSDSDVTTAAYIPVSTAKAQMHADEGYSQFTVVPAASVESASTFAKEIEAFFEPYYAANEDYQISTTTLESLTESMNEMIQTVSIAIAFIAAISLLVGGIGVMNIMLVSITERTREIGVRKALGAKNSSIRLQFITESIVLCLVGGILGILLGITLGAIAANMLGYQATAPIEAIAIAVMFSMAIGTFFGYYPANKAAGLNPIDALRYE